MSTVKLETGEIGLIALPVACRMTTEPLPALRPANVRSPLLLCTKEYLVHTRWIKDTATLNAVQWIVEFQLGVRGRLALFHAVVENNAVKDAFLLSRDVEEMHANLFPSMKIVIAT
jgi:hypothetical protein